MNRLIIIVLLAELGIVVASAILGAIWEVHPNSLQCCVSPRP
jgi:hypothetical protein